MSEERVEAVAWALAAVDTDPEIPEHSVEQQFRFHDELYRKMARAALQALADAGFVVISKDEREAAEAAISEIENLMYHSQRFDKDAMHKAVAAYRRARGQQ